MTAARYDAVVLGAGHNGLVAAGYLATAGRRVLVLERSERAGGAMLLSNTVGRLRASVVRDLGLTGHGLTLVRPAVRAFAPQPGGPAVTLWSDPGRTAEGLRTRSVRDAEAWPRFDRKVRALASFLAHLGAVTPPDIRSPSFADALTGVRLGRGLRKLGGPRQAREALRVLPMAVADLVEEAFETDALRGLMAARGVRYAAMGPRSAGSAMNLLADSATPDAGAAGETAFVRGGPERLAEALVAAATAAGAEVRTGTEVTAVRTKDGRATGVVLDGGGEIAARAVVSSLDPKRTLLDLVDPVAIGPTLRWQVGNLRGAGTVSLVDLELSALPRFAAGGDDGDAEARLSGRIVVAGGPMDLERAFDASKYGRVSERPFLEATIPSLADPSQALPGGGHPMRVLVQWTPRELRDGSWESERDALVRLVVATLEEHAPGLPALVTGWHAWTPADLEDGFGITGGHPMHLEHGLDQFFLWRPLLGFSRYRMPVEGLYLAGAGAHPGGGVTGAPGANAAREVLADLRKRRG